MNDSPPLSCPCCGSHRLIAHRYRRNIFLDDTEQRIPLLTLNFSLNYPIIEENEETYTCSCSWTGTAKELDPKL